MTAMARKGWCPTLFEPMRSGDGLIVRIKPRAATLEAAAASGLADAAARYANGIVELTNRANIQLRGARPESLAPIAAAAARLRLAATDPAAERVRNVIASPLGPDDFTASFDAHALAIDIERMLETEPRLAALPGKFGFLVDGGGALPLAAVSADIMLRPSPVGVRVELAGSDGAFPCSAVEAVSAARRLALGFIELSGSTGARRMRDLVRAVGADAVAAAAGLTWDEPPRDDERSPAEPVAARTGCAAAAHSIGFIDLPARGAFGIGLPFGQIEAQALAALADLARHYGDGTLRTTPWRAFLIVGVTRAKAAALVAETRRLGLIADHDDARLAIEACPGRPACPSATVATRADAARLAALGWPRPRRIHVSGCAKGCAHPGPADATLVGDAGRYDVVIAGTAQDQPVASGLALDAALALLQQHWGGLPS